MLKWVQGLVSEHIYQIAVLILACALIYLYSYICMYSVCNYLVIYMMHISPHVANWPFVQLTSHTEVRSTHPPHATQNSYLPSDPLSSPATMAQTSSSPPPLPPDMIDLNLTRLLSRLDKKIPQISVTNRQSKPAPGILPGVIERRKIAAVCTLLLPCSCNLPRTLVGERKESTNLLMFFYGGRILSMLASYFYI